MAWWGKVFGGTFGFMLGGPLGAVLGAALGHTVDKGVKQISLEGGFGNQTEKIQTAFFTASFTVMGYLAKSDGRVSEDEIRMAEAVMRQMRLNAEQRELAMRLFYTGKNEDFELDAILQQLNRACGRRHVLKQMFMEIQVATVAADGHVDDKERLALIHIGGILGFDRSEIDYLLGRIQAEQRYSSRQKPGSASGGVLKDAFNVLGLTESARDEEVKKAYRRLMSQHHPDKLVAKGLPEEMMQVAKEKTQEIKQAYEQIRSHRGFR